MPGFAGFNQSVVAAAWIGSDGLDPLGRREAGGIAALPMWTSFMAATLNDVPAEIPVEPPGIKTMRIDRKTGELATGDTTMLEYFLEDNVPDGDDPEQTEQSTGTADEPDKPVRKTEKDKAKDVEQLF